MDAEIIDEDYPDEMHERWAYAKAWLDAEKVHAGVMDAEVVEDLGRHGMAAQH